jgi:hypothetical protein
MARRAILLASMTPCALRRGDHLLHRHHRTEEDRPPACSFRETQKVCHARHMDTFTQRTGNHRFCFLLHEILPPLSRSPFSSPLQLPINTNPQFLYHKNFVRKLNRDNDFYKLC